MIATIHTDALTELGDKCEVKFDIKEESMIIRVLGVEAKPEYVVLDIDTLQSIFDLLSRLERSRNDGQNSKEDS